MAATLRQAVVRPVGKFSWLPGPTAGSHEASSEAGFTLIEMLLVVVILSVAILGLESVQLYAIKQIQQGDDWTTSASIALDVMEMLRTRDPATIVALPEASAMKFLDEAYDGNLNTGRNLNRGGNEYLVNWDVRVGPNGEKIVDVFVRWNVAGYQGSGTLGQKRYTVSSVVS